MSKKQLTSCVIVKVGARASNLSKAQVQEVLEEIQRVDSSIAFDPIFIATRGDVDKTTSLKSLEKTDFFTKELDQMLLDCKIRACIHSAKDLPDPLLQGLRIAALTQGVDSHDVLVFNTLPQKARIATSSLRREEGIKRLWPEYTLVDIRGTIEERLAKLQRREVDGIVIAKAALIRLKLTHLKHKNLPFEPAPMQGRLAVVVQEGDDEMLKLFFPIHADVKDSIPWTVKR